MLKVTFLNFELGYDSGMQTLVGAAGQHYGGPSIWSPAHGCQRIVATFPSRREFLLALEQIARGFSLYGRRWSVAEIEEEAAVNPAAAPAAPVSADKPGPVLVDQQPSEPVKAVWINPVIPSDPPKSPKPEVVHDRLPAAKLKEIAGRHRIDISELVTRSEIAAFINLELENRAMNNGAVPA